MFFKFTTAGESHGKALVVIIEGLPAGVPVDVHQINLDLRRRQGGYGRGGRMKIEKDTAGLMSGVRHGKTLGSPIAIVIENRDFVHWQDVMSVDMPENEPRNSRRVTRPRPGHADLPGGQKYQTRDLRDILERASARETAARVAAGSLAKQFLSHFGIDIRSHVIKIGSVPEKPLFAEWEKIAAIKDDSLLNCADSSVESEMVALIDRAKAEGDTLGGIFEVVARGVVPGLGSHTSWTEKLDARIAMAIMSIQAVKAVEIGTGVENASLFGSQVHDEIFPADAGTGTIGAFSRKTNRAGGLEGGITNGEEIRVRGYLKPISTLRKALQSVDIETKSPEAAAFERSDITAVPAAGVIGESMLASVLANAVREKFGGDSLTEALRNYEAYLDSLRNY